MSKNGSAAKLLEQRQLAKVLPREYLGNTVQVPSISGLDPKMQRAILRLLKKEQSRLKNAQYIEAGKQVSFGIIPALIYSGGQIGKAGIEGVFNVLARLAENPDPVVFGVASIAALDVLGWFANAYPDLARYFHLDALTQIIRPTQGPFPEFSQIRDKVAQCINEHIAAGVPVPPNLYQLRDLLDAEKPALDTGAKATALISNFIPGAGGFIAWLTSPLTNALDSTLVGMDAWCAKDIKNWKDTHVNPPGANCYSFWQYKYQTFPLFTWGTRTFTTIDEAIRSWDATNIVGEAGNLLEVTICDFPSPAVGPPQPSTKKTVVIKTSTVHPDVN